MSIDQADWHMTPDEERKLEEKYESRRTERDIVKEGVNEMRERHGRRDAVQKKRDQIRKLEDEISEMRSLHEGLELDSISKIQKKIYDEFDSQIQS